MKYSENFKKSQLKKIPNGYEMQIDCKVVLNVTDENGKFVKFWFDTKEKMLNVLEEKFSLLTITYES